MPGSAASLAIPYPPCHHSIRSSHCSPLPLPLSPSPSPVSPSPALDALVRPSFHARSTDVLHPAKRKKRSGSLLSLCPRFNLNLLHPSTITPAVTSIAVATVEAKPPRPPPLVTLAGHISSIVLRAPRPISQPNPLNRRCTPNPYLRDPSNPRANPRCIITPSFDCPRRTQWLPRCVLHPRRRGCLHRRHRPEEDPPADRSSSYASTSSSWSAEEVLESRASPSS